MITLTLKEAPTVPLEAELLSPDTIASLTIDEIRALPVQLNGLRATVEAAQAFHASHKSRCC